MQHNLEFLSSEGRYKRRKLFWHSIGPICRKRCSCRRSSCLHRSWSCSWRRQPPNAVTKFDDFYQKEKLFRLKILKWKITCNRRPCPTQHLLRHFRAYKSRLRPTGRSKAKRRTTWLSRRLMQGVQFALRIRFIAKKSEREANSLRFASLFGTGRSLRFASLRFRFLSDQIRRKAKIFA